MDMAASPLRFAHPFAGPARIAPLLEGASFPAALWSGASLRFEWMNQVFRDLLGDLNPQWDPLGMPVRGFLSDTRSASCFIDVAYTGQPALEPEYAFARPGEGVTFWQLSYLPVPGRINDPYDVLLIASDVTDQAKARAEQQTALHDLRRAADLIDVTVLSSLDAEDILQRVLVEATEALGADWGWIAEADAGSWVFRNVHGWPVEMVGLSFAEDELSLPGYGARRRKAIAVSQKDATRREEFELLLKHDIGSFALVPLKSRGDVTGIMGFCWDSALEFSTAQRELLGKLELSLSLALENARQYEAERRLTRTLRGAFFGAPRSIPGFDMGHLYHVAAGTGRVGGDFYDVVPLPQGRLGVVIGDVVGRTPEIAGLTALVKSAMRAEMLQLPSPDAVMTRANELVLHGAVEHEFVSAFFGLIDSASGDVAYSIAGHPPPVLLRANEAPVLLPDDGGVLGQSGPVRYETHTATLGQGDLLVLYTDGLLGVRSPAGDSFGHDRLLRTVAAAAEETAERVAESLFLAAFGFAEGHIANDIAIVALRRDGTIGGFDQPRLDLSAAVA